MKTKSFYQEFLLFLEYSYTCISAKGFKYDPCFLMNTQLIRYQTISCQRGDAHVHLISVLVWARQDHAETGINSRMRKLIKAFVQQVGQTYKTARYLRSSVLKS